MSWERTSSLCLPSNSMSSPCPSPSPSLSLSLSHWAHTHWAVVNATPAISQCMHNGINYFAIVRFVYFVCSVAQSCLRLSNHHRHHYHPHQHHQHHHHHHDATFTSFPFLLSTSVKQSGVCSGVWGQLWVVNQMLFWRFCGFCVLCSFDMKVGLDICLYAYADIQYMCECICMYLSVIVCTELNTNIWNIDYRNGFDINKEILNITIFCIPIEITKWYTNNRILSYLTL